MYFSIAVLVSLVAPLAVDAQIGPLTDNFVDWLTRNGYSTDYSRLDLGNVGSFGGRVLSNAPSTGIDPVIIVHGNTDCALHANDFSTGFTNTIAYFLSRGHTSADIYVTTWGDLDLNNAKYRFFEAVLLYTQADKIDVIAHSMGVTLARKIIKGGPIIASDGNCTLGRSMRQHVDTFLGISGANVGMCSCGNRSADEYPTCNRQNGFYPGIGCPTHQCDVVSPIAASVCNAGYSAILRELNEDTSGEGDYVYSFWSIDDDIIGNTVWNRSTSYIVGSTANKTYTSLTHMQMKDTTVVDQYEAVVNHNVL